MSFKPGKNRVLVQYDAPEVNMSPNIVITEWRRKKPNRGMVLAVGQNELDFPPVVNSTVELNPKHNGIDIDIDGKPCVVVHVENIFGAYVD